MTRSFPFALAILLVGFATSHAQQTISNLETAPDLEPGQVFFSIDAKAASVTVCGFRLRAYPGFGAICLDGPSLAIPTYRAWTGTAGADAGDAGQWIQVGSEVPDGSASFVALDITPVVIPAGESRRFSISGLYNEGLPPDSSLSNRPALDALAVAFVDSFENDDVRVVSGESQTSATFFDGPFAPSQFIGQVNYAVQGEACAGGDYPLLVVPATLYDGPEPGGIGPLTNGFVHVLMPGVFGWAEVPAGKTLTVEPGAILKFGDGTQAASRLNVRGTILFDDAVATSIYDDEAGGDTDGALGLVPRAAAPGDFEGIRFEFTSQGSRWTGGELRYAGSNAGLAPLSAIDGELRLEGVTFRHNAAGGGFTADFEETGQPMVTENVFLENAGTPIGGVTFDMLDGFFGNVAADNAPGDYLTVKGSTTGCFGSPLAEITEDMFLTPGHYTGCALVVDGTVCVTDGATLDIATGVAVKFVEDRNGGIDVQSGGELRVHGTGAFPIQFGSLGNDSFAGDTDQDGVDTAQPGDWRGIRFLPGSFGSLSHARLHDGGDTTPTLDLQSANVTADAVQARNGGNDGIRIASLDGDLTNSLSIGNIGSGFVFPGADPDGLEPNLVHGTALDNLGHGVRGQSGAMGGEVRNSIVWNNGENFHPSLDGSQVFSSIGGFAGQNGNLDTDPLLDGQYVPLATSPALDGGDSLFAATATDFVDGSRFAVGDTGPLPDMGALERSDTFLTGGLFVIGDKNTQQTDSAALAGAPVAYFGGSPLDVHVPGFGLLGVDLGSGVFLGIAAEGEGLEVPVPDGPMGASLEGLTIATQGYAFDGLSFHPTNALIGSVLRESSLFLD